MSPVELGKPFVNGGEMAQAGEPLCDCRIDRRRKAAATHQRAQDR